ncbi:MAG: ABC1 kinase family protein [Candidatus Woesearchaeota archaeon]
MVGILRKFKNIQRLELLIKICTKHGFGIIFDKVSSKKHIIHPEKHIREILEEMGGAFVKFGQLLSLRPDLISLKYSLELEKLQEDSEKVDFNEIREIIKNELSRPINTVFKSISTIPLAVGSIAQVHLAELLNGKKVVIKIMKPDTKKLFQEDFDLLSYVALKLKNHVPSFIDTENIIDEFKKYTEDELNFRTELIHLKKIKEKSKFIIPEVYEQFSSEKMIVMDYLNGISFAKKPYLKLSKTRRNKIANNLTQNMMNQIFIQGLFHADPHPGNIFLMKNDECALIDFGIVGNLDDKTKSILTILLYALVTKKLDLLIKTLIKLGVEGNLESDEFKEDLKKYFERYYNSNLDKVNFSELINSIFIVGNEYKLKIPKKVIILGKCLATLESVCQQISPSFNFTKSAKEFLDKNMSKLLSLEIFVKSFKNQVVEYTDLFLSLPKDIQKLIELEARQNENSRKIENILEKLEVDLHYMQGQFFSFLIFLVFVILSVIIGGIYRIFFVFMATCSFCIFMIIFFKNLKN